MSVIEDYDLDIPGLGRPQLETAGDQSAPRKSSSGTAESMDSDSTVPHVLKETREVLQVPTTS